MKNFEVEAQLYGWTGSLAVNLMRSLSGAAREFAIELEPSVRGDYAALCGALMRRFGVLDRGPRIRAQIEGFAPNPNEPPAAAFSRLSALNNQLDAPERYSQSTLWHGIFVKLINEEKLLLVQNLAKSVDERVRLCESFHSSTSPLWRRPAARVLAVDGEAAAEASAPDRVGQLEAAVMRIESAISRAAQTPRRAGSAASAPSTPSSPTSSQGPVRKGAGPCFACGGPHWRRNCPDRRASAEGGRGNGASPSEAMWKEIKELAKEVRELKEQRQGPPSFVSGPVPPI